MFSHEGLAFLVDLSAPGRGLVPAGKAGTSAAQESPGLVRGARERIRPSSPGAAPPPLRIYRAVSVIRHPSGTPWLSADSVVQQRGFHLSRSDIARHVAAGAWALTAFRGWC